MLLWILQFEPLINEIPCLSFRSWWNYDAVLISQRRNCFSCKGRGHFAKDCPHKSQGDNPIPDICLRCGDTGHDMFSCCNDYSPRDIEVCVIVFNLFPKILFPFYFISFSSPHLHFLVLNSGMFERRPHYYAVLHRKCSVISASLLVICVVLIRCMHLRGLYFLVSTVASLDIWVQ